MSLMRAIQVRPPGFAFEKVIYAVKLGFKTIVLSRGKDKEKLAFALGAHGYICFYWVGSVLLKIAE